MDDLPPQVIVENAYVGGVVVSNHSNVTVINSTFYGNYAKNLGGAIYGFSGSNMTIINTNFTENKVDLAYAKPCFGGAIYIGNTAEYSQCHVKITNSVFTHNEGFHGGALATFNSDVDVSLSLFDSNSATHDDWLSTGGLMDLYGQSHLNIYRSFFYNNTCGRSGAVINGGCLVKAYDNYFVNNSAYWFAGVLSTSYASVTFEKCQFLSNKGYNQGGVMFVDLCNITIILECNFDANVVNFTKNSPLGGVLQVSNSIVLLSRSNFSANTVLNGQGGALTLTRNVSLSLSGCLFVGNQAQSGGAIYAGESTSLVLSGTNTFVRNVARNGSGAAFAASVDTITTVYGELVVSNNTATISGGGTYLHRCKLICQGNCNMTYEGNRAMKGGGLHAINSIITILFDRLSYSPASMHFIENDAQYGGAAHLQQSAQLDIIKSGEFFTHTNHSLFFVANTADYGGALYVADETNFDTCVVSQADTECFLQVLTTTWILNKTFGTDSIEFVKNSARKQGSVLYGGLLDRCTLNPSVEILTNGLPPVDSITYFKNVTRLTGNDGIQITSSPVRICLCTSDINGQLQPMCNDNNLPTIEIRKGENFSLPVVAVDQLNHAIANTTIYSLLNSTESGLGIGQLAQITNENCSLLNFSIFSPHSSEELTLYADGPCRNAGKLELKMRVIFKECTCPVGFYPRQLEIDDRCVCECDPSLLPKYITSCDPQTQTLTRRGNSWISYMNITNDTDQYSYLTYPYCPLDYCLPPDTNVEINLNVQDGSDVQCQNNRSGLLCGFCRPGLSVSLDTSRCISCNGGHDIWWLILIFITAGVALLVVLLVLNITVAVGTINGIVFYSNIIGATGSTFFPTTSTKPAYIIVSWLNLDLVFDTCFVDGLDTYLKTWIQMAFPTIIIFLLIIMVVWSECSLKFAKLIGRKNPVALLATLIFLSYAKYLSIIITALLFITLEYPHGSHKVVWLHDASVNYFSAKHLVLFVIAIVINILLVGSVYTTLLLFWQWIRKWAAGKISHKVCHFFDIYQAPYNLKHRYWSGLLLLARVILYLLFALNQSGDPGVNLIGIIVVMCSLLLLKGVCSRVYHDWKIDALEFACLVNIAVFSAVQLYTLQSDSNQTIATYVSVSITGVLLVMVVSYHIHTAIALKVWQKCKSKIEYRRRKMIQSRQSRLNKMGLYHPIESDESVPTSVFEFPSTNSPMDENNETNDRKVVNFESNEDMQ